MNINKIVGFLTVSIILFSCKTNVQTPITMSENPLLMEWKTPYGVPPFDKIQNKHYQPAFETAMHWHQAEIDKIANQMAAPTFENTI